MFGVNAILSRAAQHCVTDDAPADLLLPAALPTLCSGNATPRGLLAWAA